MLDLSGNYLDDLGVFLEGLARLEVLHLDDTNITDAYGLASLVYCPNIHTVTLSGTLLDDNLLTKFGDNGKLWREFAMK